MSKKKNKIDTVNQEIDGGDTVEEVNVNAETEEASVPEEVPMDDEVDTDVSTDEGSVSNEDNNAEPEVDDSVDSQDAVEEDDSVPEGVRPLVDTVITDETSFDEVDADPVTDDAEESTEAIEDMPESEEESEEEEEEVDFSDIPDNFGDSVDAKPEADVKNDADGYEGDESDPLWEKSGKYYAEIFTGSNDMAVVEQRLIKFEIRYIITATGTILHGPFETEEEAKAACKKLLVRGLRGTVIQFTDTEE